jgi:hypothetical protein
MHGWIGKALHTFNFVQPWFMHRWLILVVKFWKLSQAVSQPKLMLSSNNCLVLLTFV